MKPLTKDNKDILQAEAQGLLDSVAETFPFVAGHVEVSIDHRNWKFKVNFHKMINAKYDALSVEKEFDTMDFVSLVEKEKSTSIKRKK
jgi:hypothetical protein